MHNSLKNNIRRDTELFHEANKRKEEGQTDLKAFVLSRSIKSQPPTRIVKMISCVPVMNINFYPYKLKF